MLSGFYALTDASIVSVELSVNWRFECGSSNPSASSVSVGPTRDGAFHSLSGSVTAPAGAYAARVNAKFFCSGGMCANGTFARFDDVSLVGSFQPAQDPNFEANCSNVPCDWNGFGATLSRDTSLAQSGSASVRASASGVSGPAQAVNACFTGIVGGSSYTLSGFYALTDASISSVELSVNWRFDCGSSNPSASDVSVVPTRDGAFHSLSGTVTAPAGAYAAVINAKYFCAGAMCANGIFARFDDVSLIGSVQPVPDPNFEANCGTIPCDWGGVGATVSRDTTLAQSGSASARVSASGVSGPAQALSACFMGIVSGSTYTLSGFYALSHPSISVVELSVNWRFDCGSSNPSASDVSVGPTRDGAFHSFSGSVTAPAGTYAALVNAKYFCTGGTCGSGIFARFDDISLGASLPTAAALGSFAARRSPAGVRLSWRTGTESGLVGFRLFRNGVRLNAVPIHASGGAAGGRHDFVDRSATARRTYVYRLEAVGLDGARRVLGTVRVPAG
jgi:hypothetical protein